MGKLAKVLCMTFSVIATVALTQHTLDARGMGNEYNLYERNRDQRDFNSYDYPSGGSSYDSSYYYDNNGQGQQDNNYYYPQ